MGAGPSSRGVLRTLASNPLRTAVLCAMSVAFLWGLLLGGRSTPWGENDEQVHTGYLISLAARQLPTLDTPIPLPDGAHNLHGRLALVQPNKTRGESRTKIWVANHPPGAYLPAVPGAWISLKTGHANHLIVWLRATNALFMALAVGFTALLVRELCANRSVIATAAGLTAVSPAVVGNASRGLTDGAGFAVSIAACWIAVRIARSGVDRRSTIVAAAVIASAGLCRISALAVAVSTIGTSLLIDAARSRRFAWRHAAAMVAPAAVTSGWFYVRNIHLYGDPAASAELLDRFNRHPMGWRTVMSRWTSTSGPFPDGWLDTVARALTQTSSDLRGPLDPPFAWTSGARFLVGLVGFSTVIVIVDVLRRQGRTHGCWPMALPLATAVTVTFATTAQHIQGGGNAHPRYLLLIVPFAAAAVAAATQVLLRRAPRPIRVFGLAPVGALALHTATNPPTSMEPNILFPDARAFQASWDPLLIALIVVAALGYVAATGLLWVRGPQPLRSGR